MIRVAFVLAAIALTVSLAFDLVRVNGRSMTPTYCQSDILIALRRSLWLGQTGDLMGKVAIIGGDSESRFIKRIVGTAGDRVSISAGRFVLNGVTQQEPYVCESSTNPYSNWPVDGAEAKVSPDQFFVLGDNRAKSLDSTSFGVIPRKSIKGIVVGRLRSPAQGACGCVIR